MSGSFSLSMARTIAQPCPQRMYVRVSRTYAGRGMVEVCERRRARRSGRGAGRRIKVWMARLGSAAAASSELRLQVRVPVAKMSGVGIEG